MRTALYARVSTHDQHTLAMQLDAMGEFASRCGWTVIDTVEEIASDAAQSALRADSSSWRSLREEYNGSKACNDADPCPTLRNRVQRIYLATPLDAQVGTEVQIGLLPGL
jgi:hypothetical protein